MSVYTEERLTWKGDPAMRVSFAKPSSIGTKPHREVAIYALGCAYCESERDKEETFFPSHWASDRCESGKRPHCSCDVCF